MPPIRMKTQHGLLLLVILALLGVLGLLRPVEGFADRGKGPSGPVELKPPPKQPPSKQPPPKQPPSKPPVMNEPARPTEMRMIGGEMTKENTIRQVPISDYNPADFERGAALSTLSGLQDICKQIPGLEKYMSALPTQMAPTQMPTPPPAQKPSESGRTPSTVQGQITQLSKASANTLSGNLM